ncbi:unnamed protein product [Linum tenue]|uniref:DUF4408 domain-containing protein n=1 Tax=Linum tenue TaxID=586396 RepID=A0AAV0PC63_9ROSI|nr:unnamed protein product [Linum tenue]
MAYLTFSLRILLISTAVLSAGVAVKSSVPLLRDFSAYRAPELWSSISSWLRPPYLYFVINCIIITIAATSRFHHGGGEEQPRKIEAVAVVRPDRFDFDEAKVSDVVVSAAHSINYGGGAVEEMRREAVAMDADSGLMFEDKKAVTVSGGASFAAEEEVVLPADEDEFVISRSEWIPPKRIDSSEKLLLEALSPAPAEKPLVSARFVHRKPVKVNTPEGGRALRKVSKPKRNDTLENTWKMITEGRPIPLTRHLKKSDTWENHGRHINVPESSSLDCEPSPPPAMVKKSETFKDRTNQLPPLSGGTPSPATAGGERRLKKEPSLGQDELNRRVEAFINKFNEEMRMQRQESINRYKEMISRGSK